MIRLLMPLHRVLALISLFYLLSACQPKIGDPCTISTDCSPFGERSCDFSYPINEAGVPDPADGEGECIIEGCSRNTCPDEATCVKIFSTDFLSHACDPEREDQPSSTQAALNDCTPSEICLPEGLCAYTISVRTTCRKSCKKDNDCRDGYRCVEVGSGGIYLAPDPEDPMSMPTAKICTPEGMAFSEP